jgi:hypothetical protein
MLVRSTVVYLLFSFLLFLALPFDVVVTQVMLIQVYSVYAALLVNTYLLYLLTTGVSVRGHD